MSVKRLKYTLFVLSFFAIHLTRRNTGRNTCTLDFTHVLLRLADNFKVHTSSRSNLGSRRTPEGFRASKSGNCSRREIQMKSRTSGLATSQTSQSLQIAPNARLRKKKLRCYLWTQLISELKSSKG